jgi:uncharacterized protein (TIGR03435 family)
MLLAAPIARSQAGAAQGTVTPQATAAPAPIPVFDVAAIHLHNPEPHEHNSIWSSPFDSHFKAVNVNLIMLIHWAFAIPETQILGVPRWASTTWFNIDAESGSSVDRQMHGLTSEAGGLQKRKMVQTLLADRFKLATHAETRELPIYALVVAKSGPKFGAVQANGTTVNHGRDYIQVQGTNSIALLAEELSKEVGRDVVDKTGNQGRYNLTLRWTPDNAVSPLDRSGGSSPTLGSSGLSIFAAIQEQLGLKLESQKGPVQVLVIDHVEMPSEN